MCCGNPGPACRRHPLPAELHASQCIPDATLFTIPERHSSDAHWPPSSQPDTAPESLPHCDAPLAHPHAGPCPLQWPPRSPATASDARQTKLPLDPPAPPVVAEPPPSRDSNSASLGRESANSHFKIESCSTITEPRLPWISVRFSMPGHAAVVASITPSAPLWNFRHATPTSSTSIRSCTGSRYIRKSP